jgi:hypothetical protein
MHPIMVVQEALVTALRADGVLTQIVGDGVFDAPPRGRAPPHVVIARHDLIQRDGDMAAVQEHRVLIHCWGDQPSRRRVLDMAERVAAVALALSGVTHAEHVRTDSVIDGETGLGKAAVTLRFFSEG